MARDDSAISASQPLPLKLAFGIRVRPQLTSARSCCNQDHASARMMTGFYTFLLLRSWLASFYCSLRYGFVPIDTVNASTLFVTSSVLSSNCLPIIFQLSCQPPSRSLFPSHLLFPPQQSNDQFSRRLNSRHPRYPDWIRYAIKTRSCRNLSSLIPPIQLHPFHFD